MNLYINLFFMGLTKLPTRELKKWLKDKQVNGPAFRTYKGVEKEVLKGVIVELYKREGVNPVRAM